MTTSLREQLDKALDDYSDDMSSSAFGALSEIAGELDDLHAAAARLSVERAEFRISLTKLAIAARRVTDAFKAHGRARQTVDDLVTRRECEASMVALDAALAEIEKDDHS